MKEYNQIIEEKLQEFEASANSRDLDKYMEPWEIFDVREAITWLKTERQIQAQEGKAGIESLYGNTAFKDLLEEQGIIDKLKSMLKKFKETANECLKGFNESQKNHIKDLHKSTITSIVDIRSVEIQEETDFFEFLFDDKDNEEHFNSEDKCKDARLNILFYWKLIIYYENLNKFIELMSR